MKDTVLLAGELESGAHDGTLRRLYPETETARLRYRRAVERYEALFGRAEAGVYSAPGRSEVSGNHTDHQQGMVLAAAANTDAVAVVGYHGENKIRVVSEGYEMIEVDVGGLEKKDSEADTSAAIIRGTAFGLREKGYRVGGFNAYITSDVLIGAGLSSSAAFEVLLGTVISGLFNGMGIAPLEIAKAGQYAENVFFGKPCGLMDQTACAAGGLVFIDFEHPEAPAVRKLPVDFRDFGYSLCIVDTKGSHGSLTADYAALRSEMESVAAFFGKKVLRQVDEAAFYRNIPALRARLGDRPVLRAIHFFNEEKRVERQAAALTQGDFKTFLRMVGESGGSSFQYLQNVYTVREPQRQEVSLGLAVSESVLGGHGAARVHGGGFAGTIQAFVENGYVERYRRALDGVFGGGACQVLEVRNEGGIRVL